MAIARRDDACQPRSGLSSCRVTIPPSPFPLHPMTSTRALTLLASLLTFLSIPLSACAGPREDIEETLTAAVTQIQTHYVDAVEAHTVIGAGLNGLSPLAQPGDETPQNIQHQATPAHGIRALSDTLMGLPEDQRDAALKATLDGMLAGLDGHSRLVAPIEFKPPPASIGLELKMVQGRLTIVRALPGGPAEQAGLRGNDVILGVDGKQTEGLPLAEAVSLLRGEVGTRVSLQVLRPGETDPRSMDLTRALLPAPPSVLWELEGDVAVIRIAAFNSRTATDFSAALKAAEKQADAPLHGLVLDLRGNAGGLLDVAEQVGSLLLPSGTVIGTLRGRSPQNARQLVARDGDVLPDVRMSVLVDGRTGAGAELVAGALQDYGRALLIGQRTAGAGTIQTVLPLPREQGGLLLTSARMLRATGAPIDETGVTPDLLQDADTGQLVIREDLAADFNKQLAWRIQAAAAQAEPGADVGRVVALAALGRTRTTSR